jgi:hypothetical protein
MRLLDSRRSKIYFIYSICPNVLNMLRGLIKFEKGRVYSGFSKVSFRKGLYFTSTKKQNRQNIDRLKRTGKCAKETEREAMHYLD